MREKLLLMSPTFPAITEVLTFVFHSQDLIMISENCLCLTHWLSVAEYGC